MSLDNENWKIEVNPHYAALMKAMHRKIDALCSEEGKLANAFFFRAQASNCAWAVVRLVDSSQRLFLLYGIETTSFRDTPGCEELIKGDVGIDVCVMPWSEELLPSMKALAGLDTAYLYHCSCGHKLDDSGRTSRGIPVSSCPGCGLLECDPSTLDDGPSQE